MIYFAQWRLWIVGGTKWNRKTHFAFRKGATARKDLTSRRRVLQRLYFGLFPNFKVYRSMAGTNLRDFQMLMLCLVLHAQVTLSELNFHKNSTTTISFSYLYNFQSHCCKLLYGDWRECSAYFNAIVMWILSSRYALYLYSDIAWLIQPWSVSFSSLYSL